MGGLDSAEVCELVGLFLLFQLEQIIPQENVDLYRDDGLAVVELPDPGIKRLRKKIIQLFTSHGLKITTQVNIKTTDFLNVLLDLQTDLHNTDHTRRHPASLYTYTRTPTTPDM